jgi:hypothetical protein
MTVSFSCNQRDKGLAKRCAKRAVLLYADVGGVSLIDTWMDLVAVHVNDMKLDFKRLLEFDDFNFAHDITGIANCIDRETGKLTKHFIPRCRFK